MTRLHPLKQGMLGFHRLAIMGLTEAGMQPFVRGSIACVCNGEIYGFRSIRCALEEKGYTFNCWRAGDENAKGMVLTESSFSKA